MLIETVFNIQITHDRSAFIGVSFENEAWRI